VLLKLYIYGYLNRIQSSRRLEREAQRNVESMWLTQRLSPDFKTIANFRKNNGKAIRNVCRQFVVLCQQLDLLSDAVVAIDGSKFKAVNSSGRNFTDAKLKRRMQEIEANITRYLAEFDTADRQCTRTVLVKTGYAACSRNIVLTSGRSSQGQVSAGTPVSSTDVEYSLIKPHSYE
jgi:hypothetical protein